MPLPRPHRLIQFSPRVKKSSPLRAASSFSPATLDLTAKIQFLALANPDAYTTISSLVDDYIVDMTTTRAGGALPETIARQLRVLVVCQSRKQRSTGGG